MFHDGSWPSEVEDDFDASVVTQVIADFPYPERGDPEVHYEFVRLDGNAPLPQEKDEQEAFAYARDNE